jgi:hypothetical protein
VRSGFRQDYFSYGSARGRYTLVGSTNGALIVGVAKGWPTDQPLSWVSESPSAATAFVPATADSNGSLKRYRGPGVRLARGRGWLATPARPTTDSGEAMVSLTFLVARWWWPCLLAGALPAARIFRWVRRNRLRRLRRLAGQCVNCGYDLRATPERCPECGSVPRGRWVKILTR